MTDLEVLDVKLVILNTLKEYNSGYFSDQQNLNQLVDDAAKDIKKIVEKGESNGTIQNTKG